MLATGDLETSASAAAYVSHRFMALVPGRFLHEALPEVGPATNGESRSRDQIGRRPREPAAEIWTGR